jgi:hypothetical protein
MIARAFATVALLAGGLAHAASELALDPSRLAKAPVQYMDASRLPAHPVPVVVARRQGLSAGAAEIHEINEKVVYPFLSRSRNPVAAIVLEWHPNLPEQLGVVVIFSSGDTRDSAIPRAPGGHYDPAAYELLLAKPVP